MTHDTTPVVGDVWEWDGRESRVIEEVGMVYVKFHFRGLVRSWSCTLNEWHAWAANARKVEWCWDH